MKPTLAALLLSLTAAVAQSPLTTGVQPNTTPSSAAS